MEEVKLLRTWSSPYALRIVWALKLKGIEYDTIFEDLSNKSILLLECNPIFKKVPVLVHNGKSISESLVILEYIDETWNQTPLLPQDPFEKAKARFWAKFGDDKLMSSVWQIFITQGKKQEEAIGPLLENLKFIEEQLKGKKFFGGEKIGFLDISLGWLANLISILEEITAIQLIDADNFPLLLSWMQSLSDDAGIKETWPPRDKLVIKFQAVREPYLKAAG